jgi:hypothetical protein
MSCNENNCLSGTPARSNVDLEEDHAASIFRVPASMVRMQTDMLTQVTSDRILSLLIWTPYDVLSKYHVSVYRTTWFQSAKVYNFKNSPFET